MAELLPIGEIAEPLGRAGAGMLRYLMGVLDREDRLESGTGTWLASFREDPGAREQAMRETVLRALRVGSEDRNFAILEALAGGFNRSMGDLAGAVGLGRLPLAERLADLVSAGLASKIPEADQAAVTAAGAALVGLVRGAVVVGVRDLAPSRATPPRSASHPEPPAPQEEQR